MRQPLKLPYVRRVCQISLAALITVLIIFAARTPGSTASIRRSTRGHSHPPPRSSSPKKSGITGTARRSGAIDILANRQLQRELQEDSADQGNDTQISVTPSHPASTRAASARPATTVRRFSPERTPLRNRILNQRAAKSAIVGRVSDAHSIPQEHTIQDDEPDETPSRVQSETTLQDRTVEEIQAPDDVHIMADEADENEPEDVSAAESAHQYLDPDTEAEALDPQAGDNDYSDDDQTFEPPPRLSKPRGAPNKANSRRKRKSDALEDAETIAAAVSSPAAKRAKRRDDDGTSSTSNVAAEGGEKSARSKTQTQATSSTSRSTRGRKPLAKKDSNSRISAQRQQEIDEVVEKIKARPSAPKSLYILRRETPADDTVTHTRSGRISIKPLAYWRNEHCVYSGTPGRSSGGIEDGARFPLNSIKEIVRTEDAPSRKRARKPSKSKSKGKGKGKDRTTNDDSDSDLDLGSDIEDADPDADEWELSPGTLKIPVASWDAKHQIGVPEQPIEMEIAHAHAAIKTKEVKGNTFKYAKLLSSRFFGAGVVDLPGGGVKRAKNSRKMHMCFFVVQGRVTVRVGGMAGQDGDDEEWGTRFSVGKGGFWQVPRGKLTRSDPFFFSGVHRSLGDMIQIEI